MTRGNSRRAKRADAYMRCVRRALLAALVALAATPCAHAQDWPQRPVKLVVPYAPGGITDEAARFAARHLGEAPGLCSTTKGWPNALGGTPQAFAATIAHDVAVWREAVRLTGGLER
jgi:hypothetical protein